MTSMRIYIPTYEREKQITWSFLSKEARKRTTFVCNERDVRRLKFLGDVDCWVHPPEIQTIAAKRAWILRETEEDKIIMLDDDLRFAHRPQWAETRLVAATPEEVDVALAWVETQLDEYVHVGLGARQGNNNQKVPFTSPGRMMYALGYRPAILRQKCVLGRIDNREDFDYTLQLLRQGFPNIVTNLYTVDQSYNNPGGCHDQRTVEASNADAHKLAEFHPGLVRVDERGYIGSTPRMEVTVSWKKALVR